MGVSKLLKKIGRKHMAKKGYRKTHSRYQKYVQSRNRRSIYGGTLLNYRPVTTGRTHSTGLPDELYTRFTYCDSVSFSAAGVQNWSLNSLYDPDQSATGHQPLYFDQLAAWYERFSVYKIQVYLELNNVQSTYGCYCALYPSQTAAAYEADINTNAERNDATRVFLPTPGIKGDSWRGTMTFSNMSILGVPFKDLVSLPNYSCTSGANPSNQTFLNMQVNPDTVSQAVALRGVVKIVYYTKCWERKNNVAKS